MGGPGYTYLLTEFRLACWPRVSPMTVITRLLVDNPRRALTGESA